MFSCFGKHNRKLLPEVPDASSPISNEHPVTPPSPKKIPKLSNSEKEHAFLRAAHNGNFSKVQELVDLNIDVNSCNSNGLNALHLAAKGGHDDIVKYLIDHGADIGAKTRKNNTALHISSLAGSLNVVDTLVKHGANVNDQSQTGFTPLYMAAQENHVPVVKYLLENGADINLSTTDHFTPLAVAIQQGHDETVSLLLNNVNSKNSAQLASNLKLPPLHIATRKDDYHAVLLLLHHEGDVLAALTQTSLNGFTALHVAAYYDSEKVGRLLLENGAPVDCTSKNNVTALHVAAKWGRVAMVKVLLDFDANVEVPTRDGIRPLHCAASQGHTEVCSLLVDHNANCNSKTKNGLVPLHMVAQGNHSELVDFFMGQNSVNINETSLDFLTPFHISSHCNNVTVAQALMKYGANVNLRAMNGFTALHIATKQNHQEFVKMLLSSSCMIDTQTEIGFTALHIAAITGSENLVKLLIESSCEIDIPDQFDRTSLHMATIFNHLNIVALLVAHNANIDKQMKNGETCLMLAIKLEHRETVEYLLNEGASLSIADSWGHTALHWAALVVRENMLNSNCSEANINGAIDIFNIILHACDKTDIDKASTKGVSCLHLAADFGSLIIVENLVEKEADINCRTASGITPLHLACKNNHYDIVYFLLEYLDDYLLNMAYNSCVWSPLHFASYFGNIEAIKALINDQHDRDTLDERINQRTSNGNTSLHLAVQQVQLAVVKLLLNNFADFDLQNENGLSVIDLAKIINDEEILKLLQSVQDDYIPLDDEKVLIYEREDFPDDENLDEVYADSLNELEFFGIGSDSSAKCGLHMSILSLLDYTTTSDSIRRADMSLKINNSLNRYRNVTLSEVKRKDLLLPAQCSSLFSTMSSTTTQMSSFDVEKCDYQRITDVPVINSGFLVSFLVDARGGYMQAQRMPQMRIFVPPDAAPAPTRIICHLLRPDNVTNLPGINDCDGFASRILQIHSSCPRFQKPILIEMPHIALLRQGDREIAILRKNFDSENWKEHTTIFNDDTLKAEFGPLYESIMPVDQLGSSRIMRIITTDIPSYFALVSRFQRDVNMIGPEGGFIESKADKRIKLVFPQGALMKKIQISLEVQNVDPSIINHVAGDNHKIAVSPIITVEPKRRKFRDLIEIQMGLPDGVTKEDIPRLKLLFSISEYATKWEDVTNSTELNFLENRISHSTKISARIWLMLAPEIEDVSEFANKIYSLHCPTPYVGRFLAFARRHEQEECQLRCILITDDTADKTLECQESFHLIATGEDIEVINKLEYQIETAGNIVAVTKSDEPILFQVQSFFENRKTLPIRIRNSDEAFSGKIAFKPYLRSASKQVVKPVSILDIVVPNIIVDMVGSVRMPERKHRVKNASIERIKGCQAIARTELDLKSVADKVGSDWCDLSVELGLDSEDINLFLNENCTDEEKAFMTLIQWQSNFGKEATGNKLNLALRKIGREDVVKSCMRDISFVQDDDEVKSAIEQLNGDVRGNHDEGWDDVISSNKTPRGYDESVDESMIVETGDDWSEVHRERLSDISDDKSLTAETPQDVQNESDHEIKPVVDPSRVVTDTERTSSEKTAAFLLLVDQLDTILPDPVLHDSATNDGDGQEVEETCHASEMVQPRRAPDMITDENEPIDYQYVNEERKQPPITESETDYSKGLQVSSEKTEILKFGEHTNVNTEVKEPLNSIYDTKNVEESLPEERFPVYNFDDYEVIGQFQSQSPFHEVKESDPQTRTEVEHVTEVQDDGTMVTRTITKKKTTRFVTEEMIDHPYVTYSQTDLHQDNPVDALETEEKLPDGTTGKRTISTHKYTTRTSSEKIRNYENVDSEYLRNTDTTLQETGETPIGKEYFESEERSSLMTEFSKFWEPTDSNTEYRKTLDSEYGKQERKESSEREFETKNVEDSLPVHKVDDDEEIGHFQSLSPFHEIKESDPQTRTEEEHVTEVLDDGTIVTRTIRKKKTTRFLTEQMADPSYEEYSQTDLHQDNPVDTLETKEELQDDSNVKRISSTYTYTTRTSSQVIPEHEDENLEHLKSFGTDSQETGDTPSVKDYDKEVDQSSLTIEFSKSWEPIDIDLDHFKPLDSEFVRQERKDSSEGEYETNNVQESVPVHKDDDDEVIGQSENQPPIYEINESDPLTETEVEQVREVQEDGSVITKTITRKKTTRHLTEKITEPSYSEHSQSEVLLENPVEVVETEEELPDGTRVKRTISTSKSTTTTSSRVISEHEIEHLEDLETTRTVSKETGDTPTGKAPSIPVAKSRKNKNRKKSNRK